MSDPSTVEEVIADAKQLRDELTEDLNVNLDFPPLDIDLDIEMPPTDGPIFAEIPKISLGDLTTVELDGSGVFDVLMQTVNLHLKKQHEEGRITGGDFAKVYMTAIEHMSAQATQFLLSKDRAYWETLNAQATAQIALANRSRAIAEIKIAQLDMQIKQYEKARIQLAAHTAENEYALSSMRLVEGYNGIIVSENQSKLTLEQVEAARGQTLNTRTDGSLIDGLIGSQKAQAEAQISLVMEQVDGARAATKDTLLNGGQMGGDAIQTKLLKEAQTKYITEQYESQRGQTRPTLSTGETIAGLLGAQVKLYDEQRISYKRDAESKYARMLLDTWTARKTIDEGVAVPVIIDTAAIDQAMAAYKGNLGI